MHAWEASVDRQLVARLARPIVHPGVIRMALVRRILAGVAAMTARLPLAARFGRRRELAATTPIVYARWTPPAPVETTAALPITRPIVHAAPSRAVERSSALASTPTTPRELPAPATAHPIAPATPRRAVERSSAPASVLVATRELPAPAMASPIAPRELPAPATAHPIAPNSATVPASTFPATSDARPEVSHASSRELTRSADPMVRRSRVGAPLPARPQITRPSEGHVREPARPLITPFAPAAATLSGEASGRSIEQPAGEVRARGGTSNPRVRVRPRATVAGLPAMIANTTASARTPVVVPATARQAPLPMPVIRPVVAAVGRPARSFLERHPMPIVPVRSGDGGRARAMELPLAHPSPVTTPAAAQAALAALPSATTPRPIAAPRPIPEAAPPPAPPPQKIDLPRLAEQVQRILVRQTAHARARQGLPR